MVGALNLSAQNAWDWRQKETATDGDHHIKDAAATRVGRAEQRRRFVSSHLAPIGSQSGLSRRELGAASDGWAAWTTHLAQRRKPRPIATLLPGKQPPLAWGLPPMSSAALAGSLPGTCELVSALDRLERKRTWTCSSGPVELATAWTNEAAHRRRTAFGVECLAWCRALPALIAPLPADLWWRLFEALLGIAQDDGRRTDDDDASSQWIRAELPLSLAYLFPEIVPARSLGAKGAAAVFANVDSLVAADGMPSAKALPIVPALLATWTRSRAIARRLKKSCWCGKDEERFTAFARQVLRLSRRDGTMTLSVAGAPAIDRNLFLAAFEGTSRADRALAGCMVPGFRGPKRVPVRELPSPAANNEASGVSILRPRWSRGGERLSVAHRGGEVWTELACGRDVLWSGEWAFEVRREGAPLLPEAEAQWEETCWTSNEDVDYLELELALPHGVASSGKYFWRAKIASCFWQMPCSVTSQRHWRTAALYRSARTRLLTPRPSRARATWLAAGHERWYFRSRCQNGVSNPAAARSASWAIAWNYAPPTRKRGGFTHHCFLTSIRDGCSSRRRGVR